MSYWIREPVIGVVESYGDIISARKRAMQLLLRMEMRHRSYVPIYTSRKGKTVYGYVHIRWDGYQWQSLEGNVTAYTLSTTGKLKERLY